jgi:phosphatidylserine/phosphatidylglycerophosphate/cardiolipin synthase-like enzyme
MPVKILFRSTVGINKFRESVFRIANEPALTEVLIGSGFFQERAGYQASFETEPAISPDDLRTLLAGKTVNLVGVYNNYWTNDFLNFYGSLLAAGALVMPRSPAGLRWHAKVILAKPAHLHTPTFALIGSSNMTRPAFGPGAPFNFECDVLIWDEHHPQSDALAQALDQDDALAENELPEVVNLDYQPARNGNRTIGDLLSRLEQTVLRNLA